MTPLIAQELHALCILRGWERALVRFHLLSSYLITSLPYLAFLYAEQDTGPDGPVLIQYRLHFLDKVFTKNIMISTLEKWLLNALLKHFVLLVFPNKAVLCCNL